ncbi:ABC transporter permease [Leptolyngbya sp. 7M]|uniref:ABC transporter permease n=1 Tax=Leptolyngbya sp. 7M TaxID=2812896 RepID=UPI001B8D9E57|nr:FtsX-like permease family protein [Leptolyngbya sp. 7M]QYO66490.1 FtsX-like permease family protein [Leptolyngbya sp. 7M]
MVGSFVLDDGSDFDHSLLANNGAVVARILLEDLSVAVGDRIKIGGGEFEIRGTFDQEPGGASGFRLGPRVFIQKRAFEEAGITQSSSRVRRAILYRTSNNPTGLVGRLRDELKGTTLRVQSYRETQERLGEQFARTENYLALTGLLILVLGGVGVWNVSRAFVEQKRKAVAVLKCLGASGNRIIAVYLFQVVTLGLIGSLFGLVLAQLALWLVQSHFAEDLPEKMSYTIASGTALQGIALGVLISTLFSILPLLQVRNIKPRLLLRDETNASLRKLDPLKWVIGGLCITGVLALAIWQAGSLVVGIFFIAGLAITSAVLFAAAHLLVKLLSRLRGYGPFAFRQAINSLYRPGNQTRVVLLAVGLGAFVVLAVQSLQTNLVREFDFTRNQRLPALFFADVQKSQVTDLAEVIREKIGEEPEITPTVRARIAFVNGKPIDFGNPEVRQQQGQIGREFAVTYRPQLDANEKVIAGRWWDVNNKTVPEVSVEEVMASRLKVIPGDSITFDISGRTITARVAGIRSIDLRNTRTAFIFVFSPGVLEQAPQSFAATVLKRVEPTERQRLQRQVLDRFPNVQIFDVADIISAVQKLINNFVLAISFVGGFVVLTGILILIGSIALTKSQRIYENAILKTLGTRRIGLVSILFGEYGILGLLAGMIGSGFAAILSWAVSSFVLDIQWQPEPMLLILGAIVTAVIVMLVGAAASFDVLFKKPLSTLRSQ